LLFILLVDDLLTSWSFACDDSYVVESITYKLTSAIIIKVSLPPQKMAAVALKHAILNDGNKVRYLT
jgi:hypothetical protein